MKKFRTILFTAVIFFAATMPFRSLFDVLGITEMRPASALPPVFGLLLGWPGALGCAIGNLAADLVSGYDPLLCALGFPAQFIYGAVPWLVWTVIQRRNAAEPQVFKLHNVKNVIRYIVLMLANSALIAFVLGALMQGFAISPLLSTATLLLFLNNFVFCMVLGIPLVIFLSKTQEHTRGLTLNERLVLVFLLMGVLCAGLIGLFAYLELHGIMTDPLAMWNRIYVYMAIALAVSNGVALAALAYAEKKVTVPIESIADLAHDYVGGKGANVEKTDGALIAAACEKFSQNHNETGLLAGAFGKMVLDLETYIKQLTRATAEKERIGAELAIAAQIQTSMLPCARAPFPDRTEFDISAAMQPAREVGGDFYDFFLIGEDILAVVIADVSGKGIPAALFMVVAKTLIKNIALMGRSPSQVFAAVNPILCENNDAGMFVTAFMAYINLKSGKCAYVNAGHNPPLVKSGGGDFAPLAAKPSFVLAGMEGTRYAEHEIRLKVGDVLYLYTDGVTEAMNKQGNLFTEPRLLEKANQYKDSPAKELLAALKVEIDTFANGVEQADDITMLALRING
ncbi:MAG: SpoIIE family protein phosphatase [Clostridiales bacterium]|nr:SpoIIE family protein phosphatase [Clostridiales bacterium]